MISSNQLGDNSFLFLRLVTIFGHSTIYSPIFILPAFCSYPEEVMDFEYDHEVSFFVLWFILYACYIIATDSTNLCALLSFVVTEVDQGFDY